MDTLLDFVELIIDVWKTSSFGIGMEKMLIAFLIFLSFAFVRGLFSRFVLQKMSSLAAKTETQMDDVMIVSLERPLKFFFLVIGLFFAVEYLQLGGLSAVIAEKLLKSFVAVGLFWFFYAAVTPLSFTLHNLESTNKRLFLATMLQCLLYLTLLPVGFAVRFLLPKNR